jgi:chromosome segregation ATPase
VFVSCSPGCDGDYDSTPPLLTYYTYSDQPNPLYKRELAEYRRKMKAYEKKLPEYEKKMVAYESKLAEYNTAHLEWEQERDRKALPKLEAQIKDLTKKVSAIKSKEVRL